MRNADSLRPPLSFLAGQFLLWRSDIFVGMVQARLMKARLASDSQIANIVPWIDGGRVRPRGGIDPRASAPD